MSDNDISNPTTWSDYDFLEFAGFVWKARREGYAYAVENYAPCFESDDLRAVVDTDGPQPLRTLYRQNEEKVDSWSEAVGYDAVSRIWTAHLREEKERREAHLLWAVQPGCDWDYAAWSVFESREAAERWIEGRAELVEKYGWKPWDGRLLHRTEPGGEWTTVPLAA